MKLTYHHCMEPEFPFEIVIEGAPPSSQGSARARDAWRKKFRKMALTLLPEGHWSTRKPTHVTIYYFPDTEMEGDIDNIIKGILDSIKNFIIVNDKQVERILVEKFEPTRIAEFDNPSAALSGAMEMEGPRVYVRIDIRGEELTE